jgi:hypothetical protein
MVDKLTDFIAKAERGEIRALAIVAETQDRCVVSASFGGEATLLEKLGMLDVVRMDLFHRAKQDEFTVPPEPKKGA